MGFVGLAAVLALIVVVAARGDARCRDILDEWAEHEGYALLDVRRKVLGAPFLFRGKAQRVYEIEVRDGGQVRTGRAKVGGFFFGSLERQVVVRWDW